MKNTFQGEDYRFTILTEQLIRLEYSEEGYFEDGKTQVVQNRNFPAFEFKAIETEEKLEIITKSIHLHYKKGAFSPENLFIDARNNFSFYRNRWHYGEEFTTLKGTASTLDRADGAIELEEGILSKNGFAILDDSNSFLLNDAEEPTMRPGKAIDLYFFGHGRDYFKALEDFYALTGPTPLLPRYALGNWWSRFFKYSEESYLELMNRFEEEEIPLSVSVIDMDWHLTDIPGRFGSGWTGYTWNKELFPEPERFLKKLHDRGLTTTLNLHPADGIRAFEDAYPQIADSLGLNRELEQPAIFDMSDAKFRESYFKDVLHPLENQGVDFWWIDWQQGIDGDLEGVDPLWLLNFYHYKDIQRKGKNDIILSRYAGPGSHRFPIGFSGDTIITWESLEFQPYFTSTASNIGYTWWSHDIGGHRKGYHDEELATRWLQFGIFSPINRLHSSGPFTGKEPWKYSDQTHKIMKRFMNLRHELIPYLYTMNVKTHEEAMPLVKPMYYHYPLEENSYNVPNQYFFGSEMFVAPITQKTDSRYKTAKVNVWFPEGTWYDFFTGAKYDGDTKFNIYRDLEKIPVFVKEGGIIPLDPYPALAGCNLPEDIDWHIFPGASNTFELIEDIGDKRALTTIELDWKNKTIKITVSGDLDILPENRQHQIIFRNSAIENVLVKNKTQKIIFGSDKKAEINISEELYRTLDTYEIDYHSKASIWEMYKNETDFSKRVSFLNNLEDKLREQIFEILYIENSYGEEYLDN